MIPSETYDREYFLSDRCEGWDQFRSGHGLSALKQREVDLLEPGPGVRMFDAGCGRGEVLLACARAGASVAGIDYAEAAVELAAEVLAEVDDADIRHGSITELPWEDASFDRALLGDVIEHLTPEQAEAALRELRRVLAPAGKLVVHTAPNLDFLRYGWPVARIALKLLGRGEAVKRLDYWIAESKNYHVNEQSVWSLRRSLRRAGFEHVTAWVDPDVLRSGAHHLTAGMGEGGAMALAARAAGAWPLRRFLGNDLYAVGQVGR